MILQRITIKKPAGCLINLALEVLGDRWHLIVIR